MNLLTNFAGPVCLVTSPTEQAGFMIVFIIAAVLLLIGFINLKLYTLALGKWSNKSSSGYWQRALLLNAGVLTTVVVLGFFTGTSVTNGYCNDGVWEGLQIPLMWVAMVTTTFILVLAIVLGFLFLARILIVIYKNVKNRN